MWHINIIKCSSLFALLTFSQIAFALLPPFYQSTKEMVAILSSEEVAKKLASPYPIQSISKIDSGYRIVIQDCHLDVKIKYIPPEKGIVGPAKFEIEPQEKICHQELQDKD